MPNSSLNSELVQQLVTLKPGHLPEPVFEAVARLVVTPTFVVVPVFWDDETPKVVLTRRKADDSQYAGMLHPPGKILLASDNDIETVFARLIATELANLDLLSAPVFVGYFFEQITRGKEISMVHYLEVSEPPKDVLSYDCFALPDDLIPTDVPRIDAAVKTFMQARR